MQSNFKYRIIALTLAIIFAAFNIGLPIVIASCPMMEMTRGVACCEMNSDDAAGVVKITNTVDRSCCETSYAADRNKTEFLQEQLRRGETTKLFSASLPLEVFQSAIHPDMSGQSAITQALSPHRSVDIPILVSSLLI
jgi:hypothetical protein